MRAFLLALFLTIPATAPANEAPPEQEAPAVIPTVERDFVNSINKFEKSAIVEQFGERQAAGADQAAEIAETPDGERVVRRNEAERPCI